MKHKFIVYILFFINLKKINTATIKIIDNNFPERKYNDNYYFYKIPLSMMNFQSNGNSKKYSHISYVFGGDINTYWSSNKYQDDSFLNNIEITFTETVTIDKMLYYPFTAPNSIVIGYPNELKIYYKLRNPDGTLNEDESFYLLVGDIITETTTNKVIIIFDEEIVCDQIKLEWTIIIKLFKCLC